jgi:hypothetical protein
MQVEHRCLQHHLVLVRCAKTYLHIVRERARGILGGHPFLAQSGLTRFE